MVDLSNLRGNLSGYYKAKDNSTKTQKLQESSADATKMLKEMDTDKDGVVSQKELAKELSKAENFKGTQYKATLAMADLAAR
jgi:Ca2+-binding EF-hand superfamily protein